ncbi:MAG: hypothetical protein HRT35_18570 [Algicola sp.]|nr:hypothetical protein [Algicola sp.]
MITVATHVVRLGQLTLTDALSSKPIKALDAVSVVFRADSASDFIAKDFNYKFDSNGHLNFFSQRPGVDLYRQFENDSYLFEITIDAPGYQSKTHAFDVTKAVWDSVAAQVTQLFDGQNLAGAMVMLFDEWVELSPKAVVAEVNLYRVNGTAVDPSEYEVEITLPASGAMNGVPIRGSLAIFSLNPLPVETGVTITVTTIPAQGETPSTVGLKALTIDYSQPVNRWAVQLTD